MMKGKCTSASLVWVLVFVGGVNWGLVGLGGFFGSNWNVVNLLFGSWAWLENLIYLLVGLAALASLWSCKCAKCRVDAAAGKKM